MMTFTMPDDYRINPGRVGYSDISKDEAIAIAHEINAIRKPGNKELKANDVATERLQILARMFWLKPIRGANASELGECLYNKCCAVSKTRKAERKAYVYFNKTPKVLLQTDSRRLLEILEHATLLSKKVQRGALKERTAVLAMEYIGELFPSLWKVEQGKDSIHVWAQKIVASCREQREELSAKMKEADKAQREMDAFLAADAAAAGQ